jgi:hypothetical protein
MRIIFFKPSGINFPGDWIPGINKSGITKIDN